MLILTKETEKEHRPGPMEATMKVTGVVTKLMAKAGLYMLMVMSTRVNGVLTKLMVKENITM